MIDRRNHEISQTDGIHTDIIVYTRFYGDGFRSFRNNSSCISICCFLNPQLLSVCTNINQDFMITVRIYHPFLRAHIDILLIKTFLRHKRHLTCLCRNNTRKINRKNRIIYLAFFGINAYNCIISDVFRSSVTVRRNIDSMLCTCFRKIIHTDIFNQTYGILLIFPDCIRIGIIDSTIFVHIRRSICMKDNCRFCF